MKVLTTKRVPAGVIRGRLYDKKTNVLIALIIKQGPNFITHVI
jgi:hypothetical protein